MKFFEKKIYTFFIEKNLNYSTKNFLYVYKNKFMQSVYIKNKKKSYIGSRYLKKKLPNMSLNGNFIKIMTKRYQKQLKVIRRRPLIFQKDLFKFFKKNDISLKMNPLKNFYKRPYFIPQNSSIMEALIGKLTLHGTRAAARKIVNRIFVATKWYSSLFFVRCPLTEEKVQAYWKKKKKRKRKQRQPFSPSTPNPLLTLFEYWKKFGSPLRYRIQRYSATTPLKMEYVPPYKTFLPQFTVLRKYLLKINFTNNKNYYFFHMPSSNYAGMLLKQIFRQNRTIFTGYSRHLKTVVTKYAYIDSIKESPAV